jgi:hypothetical protein
MIATNISPLQGGMTSTPHHEGLPRILLFSCGTTWSIFKCDPRTMTCSIPFLLWMNQYRLPSMVAFFRLRSHNLMHHFSPRREFIKEWHIIPTHGSSTTTLLWKSWPRHLMPCWFSKSSKDSQHNEKPCFII